MTSLNTDVIEAAGGIDNTSSSTALAPNRAQSLIGLLNDRRGILRGQGQFSNQVTGITGSIAGLAAIGSYLYYSASLGVYPASVNLPVSTYPPALTVLASISSGAIPGSRVRMFGFEGEVYVVNSTSNYRLGSSLSPASFNMGIANAANSFTSAVITTPGGSLIPAGTYQYVFTQVDSLGRESSPSQVIVASPGSTSTITLHMPTIAYDPQTTGVFIYRTTNGGSVFYRVNTTAIALPATSYVDNHTDPGISSNPIAPNFGENSPPLLATYAWEHNNRIWSWCIVGSPGIPTVQYTNYGSATQLAQPTGVDSNGIPLALDGGQIEVTSDSTQIGSCGVSFGAVCGIWTTTARYVIYGTDSTNYTGPQKIDNRGCIAPDSLTICNEYACWVSEDGVYATSYSGGFAEEKLSGEIDATFFALNGTAAGRSTLESSVGFFVDDAYHLLLNGVVWRYDFHQKGWSSFTPPAPLPNFATVLRGVPGCVETAYLGTPGTGMPSDSVILAFDTHSPGQTISAPGASWITRPVTVEGKAPRSAVIQVKVVRFYGTGTLTAGTLTGYMDTQSESYGTAAGGSLYVTNTAQGFLIEQGLSDQMRGRVFYLGLSGLQGSNIVLTSCEVDYSIVG